MMIYNKFDIVKVPFPFTNKESLKKHLALVISKSEYQSRYNHCILAIITSAKQSNWEDDMSITDLSKAGLTSDSKIRLKVFSLDSSLIIDRLSFLNDQDKAAVSAKIRKYL